MKIFALLITFLLPTFGQGPAPCMDGVIGSQTGKIQVEKAPDGRTLVKIMRPDGKYAVLGGYLDKNTEILIDGKKSNEAALKKLEGRGVVARVSLCGTDTQTYIQLSIRTGAAIFPLKE